MVKIAVHLRKLSQN